ncbi:MAG: hypothetical protein ACP5VR_00150 [Acidimicrobiales bacterium]
MSSLPARRAKYLAPVAVLGVIALAAWAPTLSASPAPNLPALSAQQLLADVEAAQVPQLSGTLTWAANLGISGLSSLEQAGGQGGGSSFDPLSLLSGNYNLDVWLDGAKAEHIALAEEQPAIEVDLVRNGNEAWLWDSANQTVLELVGQPGSGAGTGVTTTTEPLLTPQQLASRLLEHLSPTTKVAVGEPLYVAGQPAYPLVLSPNDPAGSTVDRVEVDVGATGSLLGVPLGVAVWAVGQTAGPALSLAFTGALSLGAPPASELTFVPPPGAKVITRTLGPGSGGWASPSTAQPGSGQVGTSSGLTKIGSGWTTVVSGRTGQLGTTVQATLDEVTTVVTVGGQQGRLFSTYLLNVLFMPTGRFYAGFVTPAVLEAAASSAA